MRRNTSSDDMFEDLDLWEDVPSQSRTSSYQKKTESRDDADWDFFSDSPSSPSPQRRQPQRRSSRRTGGSSGKLLVPVLAAAVVLVVAAILLINFRSRPTGGETLRQPARETIQPAPPPVITPAPTTPVPTTPPPTAPVAAASSYRYFGSRLTETQRRRYDTVLKGIANHDTEISGIRVSSEEELGRIVDAVFWDYPEYFWFAGGYSYSYPSTEGYMDVTLSPNYHWGYQEAMANKQFVEEATRDILNSLRGKSDYEKVKGVYEYLVDNTIYDLAYTGKTMYELLHDNRGVCAAYARSAQYLLTDLGIETIYVVGDGIGPDGRESHAWNIVNVEGDYYQIDVTWGDPVIKDGTQVKSFTYLCLTDEEMQRNHEADWSLYPRCTATAYNYHVYEGYYLPTYDEQAIINWIAEANLTDKEFSVKVADQNLYQTFRTNLIDNDGMFDLFEQAIGTSLAYTYRYDDIMYTYTIEW